jgi:predicted nucleic acid-binding protein
LYLIDTNIWLERLLNQEKSEEVRRFLDSVPSENLYITDFTLHSIGVILHRLKKLNALIKFVQDIFINGKVNLVHLGAIDMLRVVDVMKDFNLDFDDAYQYVATLFSALSYLLPFQKSGLKKRLHQLKKNS